MGEAVVDHEPRGGGEGQGRGGGHQQRRQGGQGVGPVRADQGRQMCEGTDIAAAFAPLGRAVHLLAELGAHAWAPGSGVTQWRGLAISAAFRV